MSMNLKTIPIVEASDLQLRQFAEQLLQVPIPPNASRETILAKLQPAWQGDAITVMVQDEDAPVVEGAAPPADPNPEQPTPRALKPDSSKHDPKVEITLHQGQGESGRRALPVGVNGVFMLIPRGKKVAIPYRYYQALKNAVKTVYRQPNLDDEDIIATDVPAYPFETHKLPSDEEVAAYVKRQAEIDQRRREILEGKTPKPAAA